MQNRILTFTNASWIELRDIAKKNNGKQVKMAKELRCPSTSITRLLRRYELNVIKLSNLTDNELELRFGVEGCRKSPRPAKPLKDISITRVAHPEMQNERN